MVWLVFHHVRNRTSFLKLIQRLEKKDFLHSFYQPGFPEKILYPSEKIIKKISPDQKVVINKDHLFHDATLSNVARSLLKYSNVQSVQLRHQFFEQKNFAHYLEIDPDGILIGTKDNMPFTMGVEIELHQKSRSRIFEKFENYAQSPYFTAVIYFFDRESVYKSYKLRVQEFDNKLLSQKIILTFAPKLASSKLQLNDCVTFYQGEDFYFEDVLN